MIPNPLKSLPWQLIIFFVVGGFLLRRIGKFVGWLLAKLWPNEFNISLKVGIDGDMNVAGITGAIALALVLGTASLCMNLINRKDLVNQDLGSILRAGAEDYFALLFVGFITALLGTIISHAWPWSSEKEETETVTPTPQPASQGGKPSANDAAQDKR